MNDNYSQSELIYKSRWVSSLLEAPVEDHPVVVLSGARQVGKSTLPPSTATALNVWSKAPKSTSHHPPHLTLNHVMCDFYEQ